MDRLTITKVPPPGEPNGGSWELSFQVLLNDQLMDEEDYTLDVESFFKALDTDGSITLIGGCGWRDCCAVGPTSILRKEGWEWGYGIVSYSIGWLDIYKVADTLVSAIERLEHKGLREQYAPRLAEYKTKTEKLKKLAGIS